MQYNFNSDYDFCWNVIDKTDIFDGLTVLSDSLKGNITVLSDFISEF